MKKSQTAIYTCITGNYDNVTNPQYVSEGCDYFLISDYQPETETVYKWIDIKNVLPKEVMCMDDTRKNRYCKIMVHEIFPSYNFSIYVDGNIQITSDISMCLSYLKKVDWRWQVKIITCVYMWKHLDV